MFPGNQTDSEKRKSTKLEKQKWELEKSDTSFDRGLRRRGIRCWFRRRNLRKWWENRSRERRRRQKRRVPLGRRSCQEVALPLRILHPWRILTSSMNTDPLHLLSLRLHLPSPPFSLSLSLSPRSLCANTNALCCVPVIDFFYILEYGQRKMLQVYNLFTEVPPTLLILFRMLTHHIYEFYSPLLSILLSVFYFFIFLFFSFLNLWGYSLWIFYDFIL